MKKKREPKLSPSETVVLRGSVVLPTGTEVPVEVRLAVPRLTRLEEAQLESVSVRLHDLSPDTQRKPRKRK